MQVQPNAHVWSCLCHTSYWELILDDAHLRQPCAHQERAALKEHQSDKRLWGTGHTAILDRVIWTERLHFRAMQSQKEKKEKDTCMSQFHPHERALRRLINQVRLEDWAAPAWEWYSTGVVNNTPDTF